LSEDKWFTVLGPVRAVVQGRELDLGSPQQKAVLALLLLRAGSRVSRSEFIDALWGAAPPATAEQTLQTYIYRLRKLLDAAGTDAIIVRSSDGYLIRISAEELDLTVFRRQVAAAEIARRDRDPVVATGLLRAALALWDGQPMSDIRADFVSTQRNVLDKARLNALEALFELELELDASKSLINEIANVVDEYPLDERFPRLLMLALHRSGQQAEALEAYERIRAVLADELGIDPGPQLQALQLQILRGELPLPQARPHVVEAFAPAQLPADSTGFIAREAELSQLDALLLAGRERAGSVLAVVHGMAGAGKTTLAVHWGHRVADRFPDGQIYLNLRGFDASGSAMMPAEGIRVVLDALGVAPRQIPLGLDSQTAFYRSVLAGRQMMIVLDNARDAEQVRPLLPGSSGCVVVVTSRNQLTSLVALDHAHPVALDVLPDQAAAAFLAERLGSARAGAEPGEVAGIVEVCGGLPLALAIVAARATLNPDHFLGTIIAQLRADRGTLDSFSGPDAAIDVRAIFSWSYQQLGGSAARLFRLLILHPGSTIAVDTAASLLGIGVRQTRALAAELAAAHLISEPEPARYQMHELLRAYARELHFSADSNADRRAALGRMLDHYVHTARRAAAMFHPLYPPLDVGGTEAGAVVADFATASDAQAWLAAEHRTLVAAVLLALEEGLECQAWQLADALSESFQVQCHWHDRLTVQSAALEAGVRLKDLSVQARAHRDLGSARIPLGEYTRAQFHLSRALTLYQELLDPSAEARTLRILANMHVHQGDHARGLREARRALRICRLASDDLGTAVSLNDSGWYFALVGDYPRALENCEKALSMFRGTHLVGEAGVQHSLGYIHDQMGDREQALRCYRRALDLARELGNRYLESLVLEHLGDHHRARQDWSAASGHWSRALSIREAIGHPSAEQIRQKLAGRMPVRRTGVESASIERLSDSAGMSREVSTRAPQIR
jgi:DNA-binding SARP family transcriptional activator/tetratricopeptide (TPR) repeat protein